MNKDRKKAGMTVIETAIVSAIVIIFFVSTVLLYYNLLLDEKKQNMISQGAIAGERVSDAVTDSLLANEYFVEFTSNLLNEMHDEVGGEKNIQKLIETQAAGLKLDGMKNINVYIDGKYYCDRDWGITDDFDATTRPWYQEALAAGGEIGYVDPYVDYETGALLLAIGKSLNGEGNVFSVDVTLGRLAELASDAALEGNVDAAMIIIGDGTVIAHSDKVETGKNYKEEEGTLGAGIYKKISELPEGFKEESFELKHDGVNYLIHVEPTYNDWMVISVIDTTEVYNSFRIMLITTIAIIMAIVFVIIFIMITANKRSFWAEQEIAVYKERMVLEKKQGESAEDAPGHLEA
ncbi:MAG: cache domain-containing protein [Lachnospiraceae bacterium]|nr:cache domain-containing protein [Lachnospiraceae bacterium]